MMDDMGPAERAEKRRNTWDAARRAAPSERALLERSGWWDVLPRDQERLIAAAREYVADRGQPDDARRRVREVWLEHKYRPAWEPRDASQAERRDRMREAMPSLGLAEQNPTS